jgi:hypothetical protein
MRAIRPELRPTKRHGPARFGRRPPRIREALGQRGLIIVGLEARYNYMPGCLEVEPQCDLNDARRPVTQSSSRTQDLTKCRAQDIGVRVGEFGVIKEIEKIPA